MINDDSSELFSLKSNAMTIARIREDLNNVMKVINATYYFFNVSKYALTIGDKAENELKDCTWDVKEVVKSMFAKKTWLMILVLGSNIHSLFLMQDLFCYT